MADELAETAAGPCDDETAVVASATDSGPVDSEALLADFAVRAAETRAAAARARAASLRRAAEQLAKVNASDKTTASEHGADAPTVIVPPSAAAAPELAWSQGEPDEPETAPRSWRSAWAMAGVLLACMAVVAFVIAVVGWVLAQMHNGEMPSLPASDATPTLMSPSALPPISTEPSPADIHAGVSPPLAASPPSTVTVTPPPPAPSTVTVQAAPPPPAAESVDDQFIAALNRAQITVDNRSNVITAAHRVCMLFGRGYSRADIVAAVKANADSATDLGAADYVAEATAFYCPQYVGR